MARNKDFGVGSTRRSRSYATIFQMKSRQPIVSDSTSLPKNVLVPAYSPKATSKIAKKKMDEYNIQMELYKQKMNEEATSLEKEEEEPKKVLKQEALQLLKTKEKTENIIKKPKETKKKQKEEKNSDPNKPKKLASSFFLFSKETRKELLQERPDIGNSTLNGTISVTWKELSDEEKQIWNVKAAEGMAAYKKEMEECSKSIAAGNNDASTDQYFL